MQVEPFVTHLTAQRLNQLVLTLLGKVEAATPTQRQTLLQSLLLPVYDILKNAQEYLLLVALDLLSPIKAKW